MLAAGNDLAATEHQKNRAIVNSGGVRMAGDYNRAAVSHGGETHFAPVGTKDNMFNGLRPTGEIKRTVSPVISYLSRNYVQDAVIALVC